MEQPNIQHMTNKPKTTEALRRVLRVLFPIVSMISFFLSYYYYHLPSSLRSVDISALNNFSSRKAMFLFCNAILIFLAKDSGLLTPSVTTVRRNEYYVAANGEYRPAHADCAEEEMAVEEKIIVEVTEESVDSSGELAVMEEIGEGKEVVFVEGTEHIDELNRKCEQFIEKMKREIGRRASHV